MLSFSCLRGAQSWQRPTLPPSAVKHMRNQALSSAVVFSKTLRSISVRAPGTRFKSCMAANVPSDMGTQPGSDQALNAAEEKVRLYFVDGVVPAQRLKLDAQTQSLGVAESLAQKSNVPDEETFEYSWDDCLRESPAQTSQVRILTWNTLADGLAQHGDFVKVPSKLLDWESRAPLLLRELEEAGADVICLQEVNHFDDCFLPKLEKLGYSGRFQPKILSPSARFGYGADGVALFYKSSRFEMRGYETLQFVDPNGENMSQCALLCRLRDLQTGDQMLLATTHLKAKTGADNDATRAIQIKQLLKGSRVPGAYLAPHGVEFKHGQVILWIDPLPGQLRS
eukprot:TRINITY_DN5960_c0_g1_i1.p1 TRINITY_DN5960_c0_g1~~TRINITY_DN5960_c0_g1_i1.p1  ORF type:complete len:339 (+),score=33.97 TRINITY_DN5960_c0_g1_i1:172-1188(+)